VVVGLRAIYALVVFLSASLLFLAEPMTAKRLLPAIGGSAAVWITCLVFYQCALLGGYFYAHLVRSRLKARAQAAVHTALLVLATAALAVKVQPDAAAGSWHPLRTTLELLTAMIGLPFVALAATTPLVQSWYARVGERPGWRLYALSNLGSMLALVVYPGLVEPNLALATQRVAWSTGFAVFAAGCGGLAWAASGGNAGNYNGPASARLRSCPDASRSSENNRSESPAARLDVRAEGGKHPSRIDSRESLSKPGRQFPFFEFVRRSVVTEDRAPLPGTAVRVAMWVALLAASSMLLCAITGHLSQNIAAIPLLWVVPLAAYLLSFIVTFAGPRWYPRTIALRLLAVAMATIGYLLAKQITVPLLISIPTYVGALFVFCTCCHGELYRLRPEGERATGFYLLVAFGSALGAIAVGVAAPMILKANYDLAASLLALAVVTIAATWNSGWVVRVFWMAAAAAMAWAAAMNVRALRNDTVSQLRSFYGSLRVTQTYAIPGPGIQRTLFHGTIQHGLQVFNDKLRGRATSYYAPDSGVGLAIEYCCGSAPRRIGAVGLGVGTVAAYGRPGDSITFYEIDPLVERLARARFAYLHESKARVNVVLGDARLSLESETPQNFDVLVLDAFSGDAIPVHLLTEQAIELYRRHLKPGGVLAFHVSSQYVDLAPVLAGQARHAGLTALGVHSLANDEVGEFQADWVLMSADKAFFDQPEVAIAARPIALRAGLPLWTDDRNSLLPLVRWMGIPGGPEVSRPAPADSK